MSTEGRSSWPHPSAEIHALLARHMSRYEVEHRTMFGAPCYFVNGNMFTGGISDYIFLRLSPSDLGEVLRKGIGTEFQPVPGRRMREYCAIYGDVLKDEAALKEWLDRGYSYVSGLEARRKGPRKRSGRSP